MGLSALALAASAAWGLGAACLGAELAQAGPKRRRRIPGLGWGPWRRQKLEQLEAQLPGWLLALTQALQANPSLAGALRSCVRVVESPLREQLEVVLEDCRLGADLGAALDRLARRTASPLVASVVTLLKVAQGSGGNTVATLERAAEALREQARLEGVLRTKTSEGRLQARVISVLPAPVALGIESLMPGYFDPVLSTTTGHLMMVVFALMWAGAALMAHKILAVEL